MSNEFYQPPQETGTAQTDSAPKKVKKPIHKKWWFWVIIAILAIAVINSFGSDDNDSTPTETTSSVTAENTQATTKATAATTEKTTKKPKLSKKEYKEKCKKIAYKDLARTPDKYVGKKVKFTGEVIQVIESVWGSETQYRISVSKEEWGYTSDEVIYVTYEIPEDAPRILEDDIVTFYGEADGLCTYESAMGGQISIPQVKAKYIDIKE